MKRVTILGAPGAGKSTLANKLSAITHLPVIHLDRIYWSPDWVRCDEAQANKRLKQETDKNRWIIEGIYSSGYATRTARADTIIFIDLPRWQLLWRVTKRVLRRWGTVHPDMPQNYPEKFDWEFMKDIWNSTKRGQIRDKIVNAYNHAPERAEKIHLGSDSDIQTYLENVIADQATLPKS